MSRFDTACQRGHPRTPETTYVGPDGKRECAPCAKATRWAWKHSPRGKAIRRAYRASHPDSHSGNRQSRNEYWRRRRATQSDVPVDSLLFWSRVDTTGGPTACWPWTRARLRGYGVTMVGANPKRCHRIAYALVNGPIPEGLVVMHACDNPPCCNPAHLSLGTSGDNTRDAAAKGFLNQQRRPDGRFA